MIKVRAKISRCYDLIDDHIQRREKTQIRLDTRSPGNIHTRRHRQKTEKLLLLQVSLMDTLRAIDEILEMP